MNHPTEEDLVLHYYAEPGDGPVIERHLEECAACRELYAGLQRVLNLVDATPAPERDAGYGAELWARIAPQLPRGYGIRPQPVWRWAMAAAAAVVLLSAAFLAGRWSPRPQAPGPLAADPGARERVLMVAVGDYLERSQMVLIELANASAGQGLDISSEQERAQDLISETRLYRQTAATTGDTPVAALLDEIERVLLDVAHAPSRLSPPQVEELRRKLKAQGIIFKIRVVNSTVRSRQDPAPAADVRRSL